MNQEYRTTSPIQRVISATIAGFATVLIAGSIYGLAAHYSEGASSQVAMKQPVLVARR